MDVRRELIQDCIDKKRKAEYELYKLTYSYLMSICIRYTRNQEKAKEVLNMGFFKILTNMSSYRPEEPFKPWIRRIMINTLINDFKKEKVHYENIHYVEEYYDSKQYSEMNAAVTKMDAERIYRFIDTLPPASREVFNLYFIDGYKHKEIAELLNITEGTSKWHLNSAREKLKELLKNIDVPIKLTV